MPVNWDSVETWERLVAAILASGVKPNLSSVATHFGTTYDTLENRLRKVKKLAKELENEVSSGQRGDISPKKKSAPATPRKQKTPRKDALSAVANGRISKTPSKKGGIKQEAAAAGDNGLSEHAFSALDFGIDSFEGGLEGFGVNGDGDVDSSW